MSQALRLAGAGAQFAIEGTTVTPSCHVVPSGTPLDGARDFIIVSLEASSPGVSMRQGGSICGRTVCQVERTFAKGNGRDSSRQYVPRFRPAGSLYLVYSRQRKLAFIKDRYSLWVRVPLDRASKAAQVLQRARPGGAFVSTREESTPDVTPEKCQHVTALVQCRGNIIFKGREDRNYDICRQSFGIVNALLVEQIGGKADAIYNLLPISNQPVEVKSQEARLSRRTIAAHRGHSQHEIGRVAIGICLRRFGSKRPYQFVQ